MSLISFFKEAGEKLFGKKETEAATQAVAAAPDPAAAQAKAAEMNQKAGASIEKYITSQGLGAAGLSVAFDGATSTVTVSGQAADQATREKIVLCCGTVDGVEKGTDMMTVAAPAVESRWHLVERGDTLSKIAKQVYGDANAYPKIFDANKPMLKDPDKIYPGQLLRIPK
jgi:nucleoid-associated protein YgaU